MTEEAPELSNGDEQAPQPNPLLQSMRKGLFGKSVSNVVESPEPESEKPTTTPVEGNPAGDSAYDKEEPTPSVSNTAEPEASESTEVKMDEVNESETGTSQNGGAEHEPVEDPSFVDAGDDIPADSDPVGDEDNTQGIEEEPDAETSTGNDVPDTVHEVPSVEAEVPSAPVEDAASSGNLECESNQKQVHDESLDGCKSPPPTPTEKSKDSGDVPMEADVVDNVPEEMYDADVTADDNVKTKEEDTPATPVKADEPADMDVEEPCVLKMVSPDTNKGRENVVRESGDEEEKESEEEKMDMEDEKVAEEPEQEVEVEEQEKPEEEDKMADEEAEPKVDNELKTPEQSPRRARGSPRGKASGSAKKDKKIAEEIVKTPTRSSSRRSKKADQNEEPEKESKTPSRSLRRSRAAAVEEVKLAEDDEKEENEEEQEPEKETKTHSRSQRRSRATAAEEEVKSADDDEEENEEEDEPVPTPRSSRSRRGQQAEPDSKTETPKSRTPASKAKTPKESDSVEEDTPRSLRTRSAKIEKPATPKASAQRPTRESTAKKSASDEAADTPVTRTSRRSTAKFTPAKTESTKTSPFSEVVEKTPKSVRAKKSASKVNEGKTPAREQKEADMDDPYDVETQLDQHPEPLKNIHMEVHSFGNVSYNKVGSGRYTVTEKTAEERVGNLPDMAPKVKERRSLAPVTPGRRQIVSSKNVKSAPPARRNRSKAEDEEMEVEEEAPATTPARGTSRKRRGSPQPSLTPAKKSAPAVAAPSLTDDQQWEVDHPGDEHAPMELGARVFALFDKVFYPAVVISERDGHGRYKVQFVEDKVVRDVPTAGLIPLRALVAGKECYHGEDSATVNASPNAASAPEWVKAIFKVEVEDEDGKTSVVESGWTKLSLDMADWKEYINQKSMEATDVATDNISSSKSRRSRGEPVAEQSPIVKKTPKSNARMTAPSVTIVTPTKSASKAGKTPAKEEERKADEKEEKEDSADVEMNEGSDTEDDSTPLTLFRGMMFILTSAQRDGGSTNFKKKMMSDFIQQSKGLVFEDFCEVDSHPSMKPFLISDTHYRTHKYLSAMARGVPCVSHEWILKCRESCSLVDYTEFLLPAGISLLDNETYPLPTNQGNLLKGKLVLVHSNNRPSSAKALNFVQIWEPMIGLLGGRAVTEEDAEKFKLDIMLSDASASPNLLEKARADNALIVSSEWLIQGIIMDQLPEPNAHPRFQFDGSATAQR